MNQAYLHRFLSSELPYQENPKKLNRFFEQRLNTNITLIKELYFSLYSEEQFSESFENLIKQLPALFNERPKTLQEQDILRIKDGDWYRSEQLTGMQLYVDNFIGDLKGLNQKLTYFEKLGVNFLHLMPITTRPKDENDGGYAVNSYHEVDPRYGSKEDLLNLSKNMRDKNMFLMLDFVANHTSNEFTWAKKASAGDEKYQNYYYTYPDRQIPNAFEETLPEVFPMTAPGNFTYDEGMQKWVMTVFNKYQWDLNYSNPEVFLEMLRNLMQLVNTGVDIVRLDALAFMWKKLNTTSQNLPEAHALISLFRLCLQVIAPGVVFLAEAIVAPKEIIKYFGSGPTKGNECELAYNATLMALVWDAIATKKTNLLYKNIENLPKKPLEATWINYLRCHDDIGLGFEDRFIQEIGNDVQQHRRFLLEYYTQNIEWSPAKGAIFMYNPKTGDGRITGSCASLLGLEKALEEKDHKKQELAIAKITMLHGIILSYGGIPMIYAGDELGTLNDYSYLNDNNKKADSRWINRPKQDWNKVKELGHKENYTSEIFYALQKMVAVRKNTPVLSDNNNLELYRTSNPHILIFERTASDGKGVLVACSFDDQNQAVHCNELGVYGKENNLLDIITGDSIRWDNNVLRFKPYQIYWLTKS